MSQSRDKPSAELPYGSMITKVLRTFNIYTKKEQYTSSNNNIDYNNLRNLKINIRYEELRDDWENDEKEEEAEETLYIDIKQVWEIRHIIAR